MTTDHENLSTNKTDIFHWEIINQNHKKSVKLTDSATCEQKTNVGDNDNHSEMSPAKKQRWGVSSSNVCYDADHEMLETTDGSSSEFESDFSTSLQFVRQWFLSLIEKLYDVYILFRKNHTNWL